jgi:MFS family permease
MSENKDAFAALRYREFVFFVIGNMFLTAAILIQEVVLGYELYKLTHDPRTLGLIGLAEAVPYISLALFGGHLADRKDKRTLMQISMLVIILSSCVVLWITMPQNRNALDNSVLLYIIYGVLMAIGFARGIYSPASSSIKGFLTPKEVFPNAASWSSTFWQIGAVLGPGIAGFLYAGFGFTGTLYIVLVMMVVNLLMISLIARKPVPQATHLVSNVWQSIREGISFVFNNKIIFYSISLDLVAVLFGGVIAILPIFAEDILKVGPQGLGILRAAPSVGAVLTILLTAYFPPTRRAWPNMLIAVLGFGLATLVFALSTNFWLSVVMLFFTGAFDSISVVIRQTIMQVVPPDEIRGRVISVNSIFVSASNEIGAFESGMAASLFGTVPSVLLGAGVSLVVVAVVYFKSKNLMNIKLV